MSMKEQKSGKLDTRFLWGFASAGIMGVVISLISHKMARSDEERQRELDKRTDTRIRYLADRIEFFTASYRRATDRTERERLEDLLQQAVAEKAFLETSRTFPTKIRLTLELAEEAAAELDDRVANLEDGQTVAYEGETFQKHA